MGCLEFVMDKNAEIIHQSHIDSLITEQKTKPKDEQLLSDERIKEILSAGSSLTKGVIRKH